MKAFLHSFKKFISAIIIFISLTSVLRSYTAKAQTFPTGFSQVLVANGISNPTVMTFAPDGRIFVAQQTGQLRIIKNGTLLTQPFISLTVNSNGERGLLGIAFDPNFSINNYIYLYYTLSSGANNRISRFTANGDVVVAGSEVVVLDLDPLSAATNHNGGTMQFGPDGKLYIGVGENANSANSQNLDTYLGKILRINTDGSVPSGNPFTTGTAQKQRVWAYGLRNPYTITFQPGTGRLFVNDVGQDTWEEIDDATTGGNNYGWPNAEGNSTNPAYTNPIYTYMHGTGLGLGCAITGGTFFNPTSTNYPSTYIGRYFFLDYCGDWIDQLVLSGSTATRSNFSSAIAGSPVSIVTGTDGNLYFLSRDNSAVYKVTYTGSTAPVITTQPQSITVAQGNPATFTVTATGSAPLTYQWRKGGVNIAGATSATYTIASTTAASAGVYSVVVTNGSGGATSNNATLTVTAPNQSPVATITAPAAGATYAGGNVINYTGTGTDPEDGTLAASAFTWYVIFHHDTHTHPGPTAMSGVKSGSFTIPNTGETSSNVYYRLYLVVTDSKGATDTAYTDILPRTSVITINTNPQGLSITLDGQPFTAPITFTGVEGVLRTISAPSPQTLNGTTYTFSKWSQGGAQTQTVPTPVNDASVTATFTTTVTTTTLAAVADAFVRSGTYANKNYGSNTALNTKTATAANETYQTYLRFDISTLSTSLTSVKLRLYGHINNAKASSASVQVFNVTSQTWQESTITYNNKPAPDASALATTTMTGTGSQYYEWDVTQQVASLRNSGATSISLLVKNLTTTANSRIIFNSKENAANQPQLVASSGAARPALITPEIVLASHSVTFSAYPNPASGSFILKYSPELRNSRLRLVDISGRIVKELLLTEESSQRIAVDNLNEGLYILSIEMNGKKYVQKIIIRK